MAVDLDKLDRRLILIGGKGGVGRTTVAAALGRVLASRGRRTLLAFARCERKLGKLLGSSQVDDQVRPIADNLWAVNMNARAAIREIGMMVLRFRTVYRAVLENRWVRLFLRAVPALEDYSLLGKAWYHTTEELAAGRPRYDTVVFDGPATGNLIGMLRIPRVILDVVPSGPLTDDAERIQDLLTDPRRMGMWVVTVAEEMPASEAIDLHRVVRDELGIHADALVVNGVYPDPLEGVDARTIARLETTVPPVAHAVRAARTLHRRRQINEEQLRQLDQQLALERILLPQLFVQRFNRGALEVLAAHLEDGLRAASIGSRQESSGG